MCHSARAGFALALHETQAPIGRHDRASNDGSELIKDSSRGGARHHIHINNASREAPLNPLGRDGHLHAVAIQHHDTMSLSICVPTSVSEGLQLHCHGCAVVFARGLCTLDVL
jgi:hypothetical protein